MKFFICTNSIENYIIFLLIIFKACTTLTFKRGSRIIRQGEIGSLLFIIVQGEVRIWRTVHRNSLDFQDGTLLDDLSENSGSTQRDPVDQWAKEKLDGVCFFFFLFFI